MARVKRQDNSRIEHICGKGNHVIPAGDSYLMASPGFRRRKPLIRCLNHPFRPSELTTSLRSEPMSAVESFEDQAAQGFGSIEDLQAAWDELVSAIEEYVENRQSALDEWENGNSQLEELLDTAQNALDEAEGWTADEYSEDEPTEEGPEFWGGEQEFDTYEEAHEAWEQGVMEHVTEQTDAALEIAGSLEF